MGTPRSAATGDSWESLARALVAHCHDDDTGCFELCSFRDDWQSFYGSDKKLDEIMPFAGLKQSLEAVPSLVISDDGQHVYMIEDCIYSRGVWKSPDLLEDVTHAAWKYTG